MFVPTLRFIEWKNSPPIEAALEFVPENVFQVKSHLERGFYFEFSSFEDSELEVLAQTCVANFDDLKTLRVLSNLLDLPSWVGPLGFLCHAAMRIGDDVPVDYSKLIGIGSSLPASDNGPFVLIPFAGFSVDLSSFTFLSKALIPRH